MHTVVVTSTVVTLEADGKTLVYEEIKSRM